MINLNLNRLAAVCRQLGAIATVVVGALGTGGLPGGVREGLILVGGALLGVEHAVAGLGKSKASSTTVTTSGSGSVNSCPT
jgi:hypothetical protein